jgi:hypothetical protein
MHRDAPAPLTRSDATTQRRWLAGSAIAAGSTLAASSGLAGTVQIDLLDNFFTNGTGGNQLDLDVTGDGVDDLPGLAGQTFPLNVLNTTFGGNYNGVRVQVASGSNVFGLAQFRGGANGAAAGAPFKQFFVGNAFAGSSFGQARFAFAGSTNGSVNAFPALQEHTGLIPVTFTDSRINRGAATNGYVEVRSFNVSSTEHTVALVRLVFDDASTIVPANATPGGTNNAWVDPTPARLAKIAAINRQIAGLNKALRAFKKARNTRQIAATTAKIRRLRAQLLLI